MRSTCEIVADLKDGKEPTYEELKMACLVQSALLFLYQQDTKSLLKGGIGADLVKNMNYKDEKTSSINRGIPSWYWEGIKKDPYEWLSPRSIPGTEEWKQWHKLGNRILEKCLEGADGNGEKP